MSSRAKFEQSQTEPMQIESRANLRTQNRKKNLSELRTEPTLLRYSPEERLKEDYSFESISGMGAYHCLCYQHLNQYH